MKKQFYTVNLEELTSNMENTFLYMSLQTESMDTIETQQRS